MGNSSRTKEKKIIDNKEVNKFNQFLNLNEINFIELKLKDFFKNFNYERHIKDFSKLRFFYCLLKIYFQNFKDAKKIISSKNFILKYLYYIIILNNAFLIRNLSFIYRSK